MVNTDERISLRKLYDLMLTGNEITGYKMNVEGSFSVGSTVVTEVFSGSTSTTHSLAGTGKAVSFANDGSESMSFTIGSITITLLANEVFDGEFADFTSVVVTNASSNDYRIIIFG